MILWWCSRPEVCNLCAKIVRVSFSWTWCPQNRFPVLRTTTQLWGQRWQTLSSIQKQLCKQSQLHLTSSAQWNYVSRWRNFNILSFGRHGLQPEVEILKFSCPADRLVMLSRRPSTAKRDCGNSLIYLYGTCWYLVTFCQSQSYEMSWYFWSFLRRECKCG